VTVHVQFTRTCDAEAAFAELHAATRHDGELEFAGDALADVSHSLDDWLEGHELPFTPEQTDAHTLVVRPPVG
jgi:hypothetical protein